MESKFKVGDTVRFTRETSTFYAAEKGALAKVIEIRSSDLNVVWLDKTTAHRQMDGHYFAKDFELAFPNIIGAPITYKLPESVTGGLNKDSGKLRVDLVPVSAIRAIAEVLGKATESGKYPPRNWEKGILYSRVYANVIRHLIDWYDGSDKDYESGLNPLKHALCRLSMLVEYVEKDMKQFDDRPKKEK